MTEWTVAVGLETAAASGSALDEQVAALAEKLGPLAPAISVGKHSINVRLAITADDAVGAAATAVPEVIVALESVGLGTGPVRELEVTEWSTFEKKLEEPPVPELVGITEIAEMLGTSRQRASELARSSKFPAPFAELAAGPFWLKPTVARFADEWDRKPGRPKSETSKRLAQIIAPRKADEQARA
jgi:hypothetical protein